MTEDNGKLNKESKDILQSSNETLQIIQPIVSELQKNQSILNTLINKYKTEQNYIVDNINTYKPNVDNKNVWVSDVSDLNQKAEYIGVFKDKNNRAMNILNNGKKEYSYEQCKTEAIDHGATYFGLQGNNYGDSNYQEEKYMCSISNNLAESSKYGKPTVGWGMSGEPDNSVCSIASDNNVYGGNSVNAVYEATQSDAVQFWGTYNDTPSRNLPVYAGLLNYEGCKNAAKSGGYKLFGLQCGESSGWGQCFVGNDVDRATQSGYVNNIGIIPCEVGSSIYTDDGKLMGGGWVNSIYYIPPKTTQTPKYIGCYLDNKTNPTMYDPNNGQFVNTLSSCNSLAQEWGATYFGISQKDVFGNVQCKISDDLTQVKSLGVANPYHETLTGKMVGDAWVNAVYKLNDTKKQDFNNLGKLGYLDIGNVLREYPESMISYEWDIIKNTNNELNTISEKSNITLESCKNEAANMKECFGFVYNTKNKSCKFKSIGIIQQIFQDNNHTDNNSDIYIKKPVVQNNKSCSKKIENINTSEWNNFSKGDEMNILTQCGLGKFIQNNREKLQLLQEQMEPVVSSINKNIELLKQMNVDVNQLSQIDKKMLYENLNIYREIDNKVKRANKSNNQSGNIVSDSYTVSKSTNYSYYVWVIILLSVLVLILKITDNIIL